MVKVYSPHFHRMKGKVNYHKGRLGKVHFQMNRGNISMMITMKREPPGSDKQKEQRARFKAAALTFRDLTPSQRENLRQWGALRNDLISGYDWWTKAKLTDISIEPIIDEATIHDVNFLNPDLQMGNADFPGWTQTVVEDAQIALEYGIGSPEIVWAQEYLDRGKTANAMARLSADDFLVVGSEGRMLRRTQDEWQPINTGTLLELKDIDAVDETTAWAITEAQYLVKYSDGSCEAIDIGDDRTMNSVCAVSGDTVIIGAGNKVMVYDISSGLTVLDTPTYYEIWAIWGTGPSSIWIGDLEGKIWHYNGSTWTMQLSTYNIPGFKHMRGLSDSSVYAIEYSGRVWHYDGTAWSEMVNLGDALMKMYVVDESEIYVLAGSGEIYRLYDGTWTKYGTPQERTIYCFAVDDYGHIYEGGEDFYIGGGTMNRHALMSGGSSGASSATLEMADYFPVSIASGAYITYGCKMKRIDADHPLPQLILTMYDTQQNAFVDTFTPQAAGDAWATYEKQIVAPANINYVKLAAQAKMRGDYADMAYVDDFFIQVSGRYLVVKCEHPLLERTMITSEDGSIVYYDSAEV